MCEHMNGLPGGPGLQDGPSDSWPKRIRVDRPSSIMCAGSHLVKVSQIAWPKLAPYAHRYGQRMPAAAFVAGRGAWDGPGTSAATEEDEEEEELVDTTYLHVAAAQGDAGGVRTLLRKGVTVNAPDSEGRTPLHVAAAGDAVACAQLLLRAGAHEDAADRSGCTPLHAAAEHGGSPAFNYFTPYTLQMYYQLQTLVLAHPRSVTSLQGFTPCEQSLRGNQFTCQYHLSPYVKCFRYSDIDISCQAAAVLQSCCWTLAVTAPAPMRRASRRWPSLCAQAIWALSACCWARCAASPEPSYVVTCHDKTPVYNQFTKSNFY